MLLNKPNIAYVCIHSSYSVWRSRVVHEVYTLYNYMGKIERKHATPATSPTKQNKIKSKRRRKNNNETHKKNENETKKLQQFSEPAKNDTEIPILRIQQKSPTNIKHNMFEHF